MNNNFSIYGPAIMLDLSYDEFCNYMFDTTVLKRYPYKPFKTIFHEFAHSFQLLGSSYGFILNKLATERKIAFDEFVDALKGKGIKLKQPWMDFFYDHDNHDGLSNDLKESIKKFVGSELYYLKATDGSFLNYASMQNEKNISKKYEDPKLDGFMKQFHSVLWASLSNDDSKIRPYDIIESYADFSTYFTIVGIKFEKKYFEDSEVFEKFGDYCVHFFQELNKKINNEIFYILIELAKKRYKTDDFWFISFVIFELSIMFGKYPLLKDENYDDLEISITQRFNKLVDFFKKEHVKINKILPEREDQFDEFCDAICNELNWPKYTSYKRELIRFYESVVDTGLTTPFNRLSIDLLKMKDADSHFAASNLYILLNKIKKAQWNIPIVLKKGTITMFDVPSEYEKQMSIVQVNLVGERTMLDAVFEKDFSETISYYQKIFPHFANEKDTMEYLTTLDFYEVLEQSI